MKNKNKLSLKGMTLMEIIIAIVFLKLLTKWEYQKKQFYKPQCMPILVS